MSSLKTLLARHLYQALEKHDLKTPEQIIMKSDYELLRCGNWTMDDITLIKDAASSLLLPGGFTNAYDLNLKEEKLGKLTTGCAVIDETLLNGGFRRRSVIEISGESGCGKTQIALQTATRAWKEGAVYICTEDAFPSNRLQQMFGFMKTLNPVKSEFPDDCSDVSKFGEKIFVMHITEIEDLKRCIAVRLPKLLESTKGISLVVVDSIAAPFRGENQDGLSDMAVRATHLKEIGMKLLELAKAFDMAVVCINQVSSAFDAATSADTVPCLGLAWSKMVTTRIHLNKTDSYCRPDDVCVKNFRISTTGSTLAGIREMRVVYSPELPSDCIVKYVITSDGVFGVNVD